MPSFRSAKNQAQYHTRKLRDRGIVTNHTTGEAWYEALTVFTEYLKSKRTDLKSATLSHAKDYLKLRAGKVDQIQLDIDRCALQAHLGVSINHVRASKTPRKIAEQHAYIPTQSKLVRQEMSEHHAFAAAIAEAAGLRAHEIFSLQPGDLREATPNRQWREDRFAGRDGLRYTVKGKGGIVREVCISRELAHRLEQDYRLETPREVTDRGNQYTQHYNLPGGQALSQAWLEASFKSLATTKDIRELRRAYANERMEELQQLDYSNLDAEELISQELGNTTPQPIGKSK